MADFPIEYAFYPSLVVLGAGLLAVVPIWWKGRRTLAGRMRPTTEADVAEMRFAGVLLLAGILGLIGTGLTLASRTMSFGAFMAFIAVWCVVGLAIAFAVDARRARRHR